MHTHQETFEISSLAMIAQGRPGVDPEHGGCSYEAGCAAAQLVDHQHWSQLTGTALHPVTAHYLRRAGHDPEFVKLLQNEHDRAVTNIRDDGKGDWSVTSAETAEWRTAWLYRLRRFAEDQKLDFAPIETAARGAGWDLS